MKDNSLVPANEIWYTTTDGEPIEMFNSSVDVISNTYEEGKGVIVFEEPITMIEEQSFLRRTRLRKIVIPEGVTFIGKKAFARCTSLQEVVIPSSVTKIMDRAFIDCNSLREVVIPEGVKKIKSWAFYNCESLEIVHLPVGVSEIDDSQDPAFENCDNLKAIYVPEGNVDFYKEVFSYGMHWLIVEEGSDLPDEESDNQGD